MNGPIFGNFCIQRHSRAPRNYASTRISTSIDPSLCTGSRNARGRAPAPGSSIAGRKGDGRVRRPHGRCRMAKESLLRHSAPFVCRDRRISRWWGAIRRGRTLPRSPSPPVTAMDGRNDQYQRAKQWRRVSSVILDAFVAGIGESILPVLRKREMAALLNICPPGFLGYLGSFPPLPRPISVLHKLSLSFHVFQIVETARSGPLATHL